MAEEEGADTDTDAQVSAPLKLRGGPREGTRSTQTRRLASLTPYAFLSAPPGQQGHSNHSARTLGQENKRSTYFYMTKK
jgi:hypothetical protein